MTVLNCNVDTIPQNAVYIGRPSKWGNPFAITKQRSREEVIRLYREWLFGQPQLIESARKELRGKDLVCYCAPLACHGDILNQVANLGATHMATVSEDFLSPVLRLVQGSPLEPQTKDLTTGQPLTIKTGPNAGKETQKFFVACAGKKGDPAVEAFKAQYERVARAAFPQFFPNGGPCTNPNFSWKIVDGDGFDQNGQPNNTKEGFAGNWIFRFASSYAPRCYVRGKYGPADQIADPKVFPRGHYVRVSGTITDNIPSNKPGLYSNLGMVEWNAIGDVIISGPDAASVFGGAPAPAGAAPAPMPHAAPAPAAGPIYTMTAAAQGFTREQYHAQGWTDDALVQAAMMTVTQPAAPAPAPAPAPQAVAPHPGILQPAPAPLAPAGSAPAPAAPAPIAAAAPGFKMTNPVGPSYQAYIAQGWTDATLIQNGHMVPLQ